MRYGASRFSLPIAAIAAILLAGCRGNPGAIPASPISPADKIFSGIVPNRTQLLEGLRPSVRLGSENTVTADMPVPRPDTKPCVVTLFRNFNFKNFSNKPFDYTPPAACPGPWSKVVFNFDLRVTRGIQYDRTAIVWLDGAPIYFGTTPEPESAIAVHWHVERDVTDLSALFTKSSQGQVELWNCYCPPNYNAYQHGTATAQFYPADAKYPAPRVADEVLGIPYSPPLGGVATLPQTAMELQKTLPKNIERAYLDLYLQSQNKEEQWFLCVPDKVWRESGHVLGFCRGTAFREGVVSVNGQPAGLAPIFPWIFTGGMDPYLWFPIPGVQTLDFVPYRVDLTPFAGELSNGSMQTIDVSVVRAFDYFSGTGDLLLFRDRKHSQVTGALTKDTLTTPPDFNASDNISYGSGTGLFGGSPATGTVDTRSRSGYTISGYVMGSSGKVSTTVESSGLFTNRQNFSYQLHHYTQLLQQNTHFQSTTTTTTANAQHSVASTVDYPLTVSYPILPISNGYRLPIKIYQGYRAQTASGPHMAVRTDESNTVKSEDTMIFNQAFTWTGVRNGSSLQLYTYASKDPAICYGKEIKTKNNVATAFSQPGCAAQPPHRGPPRI